MSDSAFLDIKYKFKCPECGVANECEINIDIDGTVHFGTHCGGHARKKYQTKGACGKFLSVHGKWSYEITSIIDADKEAS